MSEFREFAVKGNVIDLAVGVIIGAAFGKIVDSLVKDMLMPILGLLTGGLDLKGLFVTLGRGSYASLELAEKAGAATLRYGIFLQSVLDFLVIALAVFAFISQMNRFRRAAAAAPASAAPLPPSEDVVLLREIRDALKAGAAR
jgi:large conductance mechanosensitive channel